MSITLFGIIWLFYLFIIYVKYDIKKAYLITMLAMVLQCNNVIMLGEKGVGPQVVTSLFFIFFSFRLKKKSRNKKLLVIPLLLFEILFVYMYFTASKESPLIILQLVIYAFCGYRLYSTSDHLELRDVLEIIKILSIFVLVVGLFQFLASSGFFPKILLKPFFFNDDDYYVQFNWPERYIRFMGTFMEPSYCSTFLVGMFFCILHLKTLIPRSKEILIGLGMALIATFSSTGYGSFLAMLVLYIFINRNIKMIRKLIPIFLLLAIFFFIFKDSLLNEVLFNKMESSSGVSRYYNNLRAFEAFEGSPIFGIGINNERASSFAIGLLAETGLIGTFLFLMAIIVFFYPFYTFKKGKNGVVGIATRFYLLSVLVGMVAAVPDIVLSTFWLGVYFICISSKLPNTRVIIKSNI